MNMKSIFKTSVFFFFLFSCVAAMAQNFTNKGKEFWVGYGHHQYMEPSCNGSNAAPNDMNMVLYLSAEEPAVVTVTIDSSGPFPATWFRRTYNIPANTVISTENLPKGTVNAGPSASDPNFDARLISDPPPAGTGGEGIFRKKGIHIESNVPIVAYAHIYGGVSSGATMLMPTTTWGYQYTSMNSEQQNADRSYSWMYVLAKEDNTRIEITPSAVSRLGKPAGTPFTVTLMKGQIYQLIGQADCATGNGPELTGTKVKSILGPDGKCHPVAVFSGSSRTGGESFACATAGRDNDMQQNFPEQAWGRRYLTAPFSKASGSTTIQANQFQTSVYKVLVRDPATRVFRNGVQLTGLIANKYYKFASSTADYITADNPIMVGQFMAGGGTTCNSGGLGDPEMVYLSPIEQAINRVGFYRNTRQAITVNYVTLIVPTLGLPSLRIDNSSTFNHTYPHPNLAGYTVVVKGWAAAPSQVIVTCDSAFNAITYGLGGAESYAYNAGTFLKNLNALADIHNVPDTANVSHQFNCINTPVNISALLRYQPTQLTFKFSALTGTITPSADYTMTNASTFYAGTVVQNGITYHKYAVPGSYRFNASGIHNIPLIATSPVIENCNNSEELQISIEVKPSPIVDFSITNTGCAKDTVVLSGPTAATNAYTIGQWRWTLPDTVRTQNVRRVFAPGTHTAKLYVATTEGCAADTSKTFTVFAPPVAKFAATPQTVCIGQSITLSDSSTYAGPTPINNWYWDLGNGTILNNTNGNNVVVNYTTSGTYTVRHAVKATNTNLCTSDTVSKVVTVSPKAVVAITYPSGCLPPSGVAQFTASSTDLGGQPITSYSWNFGDPASGANNTSNLQNPTHTYPTNPPATYTVTLTVMTASGCAGDTTFQIRADVKPTTTYGPIPARCVNSAPASIAFGSVTNGVVGTERYFGPGTDSSGMFNPAAAGPGVHTITYFVRTSAGCTDTSRQTVRVWDKARASFTYPTGGCLAPGGLVQFTNTSTISDGQAMTYAWDFGDPNATAGNPNTSTDPNPTHNFQSGTYNIKLTVTSANGCVDDTTVTATFNVTPVLNYPPLAATCASLTGTVSVATATVTNGVQGSGYYIGPGTDSSGNFNPSVAGPGVHTIRYFFTSTGNCRDTAEQTIRVWAKPASSFTYISQGCLSTVGNVQFNATSTVPDGQTLTYAWNFGDPGSGSNTATGQTVSHTYTEGSFLVRLTTTSSNGCVSDTLITVPVSIKPDINFPALPSACLDTGSISIATATIVNPVSGTGEYSGPGTTTAGLFTASVAGPGTHTIRYIFTSSGGCTDTAFQTITVYAKPNASFTVTGGNCSSTTGLVQFTNATTIADAQTMSYAWNFGDPSSANNTSTAQNPSHTYREGTYQVKLTVTSSQGCVDDTTITITVGIKPDIVYPALQPICQSNAGTVSVATATIANGVAGSGYYSGPGTDSSGNFNPAIAGPGTHTIRYIYTSTGGCSDTATQTIGVYPKPVASFTYPSGGCVPPTGFVQFGNNSTSPTGSQLTYLWNFNDPFADASNPNTSTQAAPSHNFRDGTYTITLTVTNAEGCVDDTSITVTFSVKPEVTYNQPGNFCASQTTATSIAFGQVTNFVQGTGVYSGPGTDANGMFTPSVAGAGVHTITFEYTSSNGLCKDTATTTVRVNPKPSALFTASSTACLGEDVTITNNSTISSGNIVSYRFEMGDGNIITRTSNAAFTYSYSAAGPYTIRMVATSDSSCVSDTATFTVNVRPLPNVDFTLPSGVCMPGGTALFTNTSTIADGSALTFVWNYGDGSPNDTVRNGSHVYSINNPVNVTLTAISAFGCTADTVKNFSAFYDKPVADFSVTPEILCQGESNVFTDLSTAPNSTVTEWYWNFDDNSPINRAQNPTKRFNRPGTYDVTLVVKNPFGCASDTFSKQVTVYAQPKVDAGESFVVKEGTQLQFNATANNTDSTVQYIWSPATGLSNPNVLRPTMIATRDEVYTLTAVGAGGCEASDFLTVKILKPLRIPNAFSPNGDNINDRWEIPNLADYPKATVEVFNRYGQRVFRSVNYSTPWDGNFNGSPLPLATYYYIIDLGDGSKPVNGSVTIIR
jgi:gliding motility-associated-like protein